MKSMTGFGRGEASGEIFYVSVEIKTVNNRFLDVNLRLPNELNSLEAELKKMVSERLSRGRADVNLQYENSAPVEYEINRPLLSGYISALKELQSDFSIGGEPDINTIVRLPNALIVKRDDFSESFVAGVRSAVELALDDLETMRSAEGASLKSELSSIVRNIEIELALIEDEAARIPEEYRERLTKKIEAMISKAEFQSEIDQARIAQEVAIMSERGDISEELARLRSHIEQFYSIFEETVPIGKRLDFLTQELNREANTIASKTSNIAVKEAALRLKAEIEKIREQIQNIE